MSRWIVGLEEVGLKDLARVGGKNAALGEMIRTLVPLGVAVPGGFVVTADAYRDFLDAAKLTGLIEQQLARLDSSDLSQLQQVGETIRQAICKADLPEAMAQEILEHYHRLQREHGPDLLVAVRSSATAEDLPNASFAGQHSTVLGVAGDQDLLDAVRRCMASLFNDRAIHYRFDTGYGRGSVALSVGIQQLVRSDKGGSGVLFTLDPETGFRDVIVINGIWGLGELIVQGEVTPEETLWIKPLLGKAAMPCIGRQMANQTVKMTLQANGKGTLRPVNEPVTEHERNAFVLTEQEGLQLALWGQLIEQRMGKLNGKPTPMDIEWAKDGITGKLFIVQARPETVQAHRDPSLIRTARVEQHGPLLLEGISVGQSAAVGRARLIPSAAAMHEFQDGEVLVTTATDPDWEPIMKRAAGIITERGGRTSHAAIVSRELGVPAIVGTGDALQRIPQGQELTLDATQARGYVYAGAGKIVTEEHSLKDLPPTRTKIMLNLATPDAAFEKAQLPVAGVGLAREEFIIASRVGMHPLAALDPSRVSAEVQQQMWQRARGWPSLEAFYVDTLAMGIGQIVGAFYPRPVIVRFSDFKTNEYRALLGGEVFEPAEENPMLGWRGASRYSHPDFRAAFALECRAMIQVIERMGLTNLVPMVPFCRTPEEGKGVLREMSHAGLGSRTFPVAGASPLKVYMMCELPSNVVLAEDFLELFDGFSIGSNDLTQLVLGIDRDSPRLSSIGNADHPAVRAMIAEAIAACNRHELYIGICGQDPSDLPGFVSFLVQQGIQSISLSPDALFKTWKTVLEAEKSAPGPKE